MGLPRLVNAVEELRRWEVAKVLHGVWSGVLVVVPAFAMWAEEMGVLQAQVQPRVFGDKNGETNQRRRHLVEMQPPIHGLVRGQRGGGEIWRHDVGLDFPLLHNEGASHSHRLVPVVLLQSLPHAGHKVEWSSSSFDFYLNDLARLALTGKKISQ